MNREIKFRVWFDNKMHKVVDIDFAYQRINLLGADIIEFKNGKLMQYTGLKDKNGVEIYENMIINNKYIVIYNFCKFALKNIENGNITDFKKDGVYEITREYFEQ